MAAAAPPATLPHCIPWCMAAAAGAVHQRPCTTTASSSRTTSSSSRRGGVVIPAASSSSYSSTGCYRPACSRRAAARIRRLCIPQRSTATHSCATVSGLCRGQRQQQRYCCQRPQQWVRQCSQDGQQRENRQLFRLFITNSCCCCFCRWWWWCGHSTQAWHSFPPIRLIIISSRRRRQQQPATSSSSSRCQA